MCLSGPPLLWFNTLGTKGEKRIAKGRREQAAEVTEKENPQVARGCSRLRSRQRSRRAVRWRYVTGGTALKGWWGVRVGVGGDTGCPGMAAGAEKDRTLPAQVNLPRTNCTLLHGSMFLKRVRARVYSGRVRVGPKETGNHSCRQRNGVVEAGGAAEPGAGPGGRSQFLDVPPRRVFTRSRQDGKTLPSTTPFRSVFRVHAY